MNFSTEQLETLKKQFATINSVHEDNLPKFHAMFDEMTDETLVQVVNADIKWLPSLGRNEARRRKINLS